jgi:hypothetical protein
MLRNGQVAIAILARAPVGMSACGACVSLANTVTAEPTMSTLQNVPRVTELIQLPPPRNVTIADTFQSHRT